MVVLAALAACGKVDSKKMPDARPVDSPGAVDAHADAPPIDGPLCITTPTGLGGRWRAEMNTNDDTGNSTSTVSGTLGYTPSIHGNAFSLDGATAISVNDGDALWPTASFTLEAWVKMSAATATNIMIEKYQCGNACPAGSNAYYGMYVASGGHPSFDLRTDASLNILSVADTTKNVADGNWHYIVGVRDVPGNAAILYVDGVVDVTVTLPADETGPMTNTDGSLDPVFLGAGEVGGQTTLQGFFTGALDDVAYFASALTPAQIAAIYAAPQGECHLSAVWISPM